MLVLDASVAVAWLLVEESSPRADALLDDERCWPAVVPMLWWWEVANVLCGAERHGRISEAQRHRALDALARLPIVTEQASPAPGALIETALKHDLTAQDAQYLVLARELGHPLATLDRALARACATAGVALALGKL